jgi:hypothetical protein
MWLLIFSLLALLIGCDIRLRGQGLIRFGSRAALRGCDGIAIGAWISLFGAVCLDVAVWRLF